MTATSNIASNNTTTKWVDCITDYSSTAANN